VATLNLKSIVTLVSNQASAVQASASALIDFSVGSILRAVAEANAAVAAWLQGMILQVLAISRLATSFGTDVDSFVNDYGLYRLSSSASAGSVTFSRIQTTNSALIPVGAQVQSADGTQTFTVIIDATNSAYSASLAGFLLPAGVASVSLLVTSANVGTATNVVAGAVNRLLTSISGVDYVNNAGAMSGGANAETDAALKIRFVLYLASLSKATASAIGFAVTSLQLGIQYTLTANVNYAGQAQLGYFYVVVDDGTGAPPAALLASAYAVIQPVVALTISFGVFAPIVTTATVSGTIIVAPGYNATTVKAAVAVAWTNYIANLGLGVGLNYVALGAVATGIVSAGAQVGGVPGCVGVDNFLLNAGTADIAANAQYTIKPGTVSAN
jgi:hypothetical protein